MKCSNCGNEITGSDKFCGVCGAPVINGQPSGDYIPESPYTQTPPPGQTPPPMQTPPPSYTNTSNTAGTASLIFGILGLVTSWIFGIGAFLGIIGLVLAAVSRKNAGPNGMATAGLILGILAVVFGGLFLMCTICVCGSASSGYYPYYYYY
ncbi:MAG: zinc-ribbon domain-containing protein [Clostridiales bacterium]|nr:zinc-ribbon domain-containing protein [Clostridiales bacterium]